MLSKEELEKKTDMSEQEKEKTRQSDSVNAILLQDILSSISSSTVVLKMDIEGYECKVNRSNYSTWRPLADLLDLQYQY